MTDQTEYGELRATIRERGTARVWIFVVGLIGWGALGLAVVALDLAPLFATVPLLLLAATFEAVYALHIGVERIGRYLQVFHETDTGRWEHAAMQLAPIPRGARIDALFTVVFLAAALVTLFTVNLYGATLQENVVVIVSWVAFCGRVLCAKFFARKQRDVDLTRFRQLKQPQNTQNSQS
jgi:hypothetical protein